MVNTSLISPTFVVIDISTTDHEQDSNQTFRGIDVFTPGDLKVDDIKGTTVTVTFPTIANGGSYPYRWVAQIRKIYMTGTTIASGNMVGLR